MNIPPHRSILLGRTWSQPWNPAPIEHYRSRRHSEVIDALFAVALGIIGAAVVFFYLSK